MFDYHQINSDSFVNPVKVPKQTVLRIYRDDPRNNAAYIKNCGMTVEIIDENGQVIQSSSGGVDAFNESMDVGNTYLNDSGVTNNIDPGLVNTNSNPLPQLTVPTNLYIDSNSYKLEDYYSSSDGSVKWVASLYFDDVPGAIDYDVVVTAN